MSKGISKETSDKEMSDKKTNSLLNCPFCGGEAELITTYDTEMVRCKKCFGKTQTFTGDYYDEGQMCGMYAIPAWNTRIPMQNIVERLEEEKEEKLREYKEFLDGEDYRQSLLLDKAIEIVKEEGGLHELSS